MRERSMPNRWGQRAAIVAAIGVLASCKGSRGKLEELAPEGANGIVSLDGAAVTSSEMFVKMRELALALSDGEDPWERLRRDCSIDLTKVEAMVVGMDVMAGSSMVAVRMPGIGKKDTLECLGKIVDELAPEADWTVSEESGRAKVTTASDHPASSVGVAIDDDTFVLASSSWSERVVARTRGEGKAAIDTTLEKAVAMADRSAHLWTAVELPVLAQVALGETPAAGLERVAGSAKVGADLDLTVIGEFSTSSAGKAAQAVIETQLAALKQAAEQDPAGKKLIDSISITLEDDRLSIASKVPIVELAQSATVAFTRYMTRSKLAEARVQLQSMTMSVRSYFEYESIELGASGCPNDGRTEGSAGPIPPLSVDCSKGPGGKCMPGASGPGGYERTLWADPVLSKLHFEISDPHYFHYAFRWKNDAAAGSCQFTAQAFGDLDGDATFSTYERAGTIDGAGMHLEDEERVSNELE